VPTSGQFFASNISTTYQEELGSMVMGRVKGVEAEVGFEPWRVHLLCCT